MGVMDKWETLISNKTLAPSLLAADFTKLGEEAGIVERAGVEMLHIDVLLDLRKIVDPDQAAEFVQKKCRLAVDYGEWFGENFKGFIRLNLATDPAYVRTAVKNIIHEAGKI